MAGTDTALTYQAQGCSSQSGEMHPVFMMVLAPGNIFPRTLFSAGHTRMIYHVSDAIRCRSGPASAMTSGTEQNKQNGFARQRFLFIFEVY